MKWLVLTLLLASCNANRVQHIANLKDQLDTAKEKLTTAHERVEKLEEEIAKQEIARIQREIADIQSNESKKRALSRDERLAFLAEQREILSQIIKNNLSCSDDAKIVLNTILTYITEMMGDTVTE